MIEKKRGWFLIDELKELFVRSDIGWVTAVFDTKKQATKFLKDNLEHKGKVVRATLTVEIED